MKGKLIISDTIKGPVVTFFEPVGELGHNNPQSSKGPRTQDGDCYLAFTTPALVGGTVPGTFLEL